MENTKINNEKVLNDLIKETQAIFDEIKAKRKSSDEKVLPDLASLAIEAFSSSRSLEEFKDMSKLIINLAKPNNPKNVRLTIAKKIDIKYFFSAPHPIGYNTYKQIILILNKDPDKEINKIVTVLTNGDVKNYLLEIKSGPQLIKAIKRHYNAIMQSKSTEISRLQTLLPMIEANMANLSSSIPDTSIISQMNESILDVNKFLPNFNESILEMDSLGQAHASILDASRLTDLSASILETGSLIDPSAYHDIASRMTDIGEPLGIIANINESIQDIVKFLPDYNRSILETGSLIDHSAYFDIASRLTDHGKPIGVIANINESIQDIVKFLPDYNRSILETGSLIDHSAYHDIESRITHFSAWPDSTSYFNNIWLNMQSLTNLPIPDLNYIGITSLISEIRFFEEEDFEKFEYNWMGYFSPRIIKEFYEEFKNGNEDAVKRYFYEMFQDKTNIQKIKADLKTNKKFESRMDLIEAGLDAHLEGRYVLSIPTLLPLIDGILIENFSSVMDGQYPEGKCPECNKHYAPLPKYISNIKDNSKKT